MTLRAAAPLLCAWLALCAPAAARAGEPAPADAREAVVLVHGLARGPRSLARLERRLASAGYRTVNVHYRSTAQTPEQSTAQLAAAVERCCASAPRVHFVTHSLGGLLVRAYLAQRPPANLGRVVMLAPPNRGSELVDPLAHWAAFRWLLGPTAIELGTGTRAFPARLPPPRFELGVIAGTRSWNPLGSWLLPGPDDGTVSVASTRLPQMADFVALPATHTFIMNSAASAEQVLSFLRSGRFEHPAP